MGKNKPKKKKFKNSKKAGVLNPLKYKMQGVDAKAGGSLPPTAKKAAEKFIIRAYIRLD